MDRKLTLLEHIEELRFRIIKIALSVIVVSCLAYTRIDSIFSALVKPIGKLVFLSPQDAFLANIKVAFFVGLFLSSPVIIFQIWRFISEGLYKNERKYALIFGPLSFIFFIAGAVFGYVVIIPIGLKILLGFSTDYMTPMITVSNYINFVGTLTLVFGVVFELPLAMLYLTKLKFITPRFLITKRRHAIVAIFIVAAALTPPDVISQILLAIPLLVLYEIGILFSKFAVANKSVG